MKPYAEQTLSQGEEIRFLIKFHWWYWAAPVFAAAVLSATVVGVPLAIALLLWAWLVRITTEQALTNKRVFLKRGIIRRDTDELRSDAVESISIYQSIWGRILGYGDMEFTGRGGRGFKFTYVPDPTGVKRGFEF